MYGSAGISGGVTSGRLWAAQGTQKPSFRGSATSLTFDREGAHLVALGRWTNNGLDGPPAELIVDTSSFLYRQFSFRVVVGQDVVLGSATPKPIAPGGYIRLFRP